MDNDSYKKLSRRLTRLRAKHREQPVQGTPPSIELLLSMLQTAKSKSEVIVLMSCLSHEYALYDLRNEEEQVLRKMTDLYSDEPMPWITLAEHLIQKKTIRRSSRNHRKEHRIIFEEW